jgi:hydrogenase maturation protease
MILVAGIGNIFKGDDGFGVEVVKRLSLHVDAQMVRVVDFGIRGIDLAYTLLESQYEQVILVDVAQRGGLPGSVYVIQPEIDEFRAEFNRDSFENVSEAHDLHPAQVLKWVSLVAGRLPPIQIVACEPERLGTDNELIMGLSERVRLAIDPAVKAVERLIEEARCTN